MPRVRSFDGRAAPRRNAIMSSGTRDGFEALCTALRALGIECVFGIPGTQTVPLFEAFRQHGLRTVLTSHELGAAFMANGYFRATGRIAALSTIPGPGFTYALTGIAEARLDSVGMLYLVAKPSTGPGREFRLQAIDQRAIAGPILKGTFAITDAAHAASVIREAHALATGGEPGPVMVELDMTALRADAGADAATPMAGPAPSAHDPASDELARQFSRSKRPLFFVGQGAYSVAASLHKLVERLVVPVMTTPSARGVMAEDHPLVLPFDPLRGHTDVANEFIDRADLVVALGCKLGHNGTAGFSLRLPSDRLVHVDIEPGTVGANYETLLGLTASVESVLPALEARSARTEWLDAEVAHARETLRSPSADQVEPVIHGGWSRTPRELFAWLRRVVLRDAIVVTDSGLHQILARRHLDVLAPRGLICPTDFQSMGFGLPAAIGAKIAAPERQVVAVVGDGGFLMSGLELLTARRESVPIAVLVFNDGHLNQIRVQQQSGSGRTQAVDLLNPDYELLAKSFGIRYLRLGAGDAEAAAKALNGDGPILIEVLVGDSMAMRAAAAVALSKAVVRRTLGPRIAAALRSWLRR